MEQATLGAGCFWCIEALFQQLKGIESVIPGYAGGNTQNPTYEEVCTGNTGHIEVCQLTYDPADISFKEILEVFWTIHDPSSIDKQGGDEGPQYRSVIFYHDKSQETEAIISRDNLAQSSKWNGPIATEIRPLSVFYPAENKHIDYYSQNTSQPYCSTIITPKLEQFRELYKDKLSNV